MGKCKDHVASGRDRGARPMKNNFQLAKQNPNWSPHPKARADLSPTNEGKAHQDTKHRKVRRLFIVAVGN